MAFREVRSIQTDGIAWVDDGDGRGGQQPYQLVVDHHGSLGLRKTTLERASGLDQIGTPEPLPDLGAKSKTRTSKAPDFDLSDLDQM